MYRAKLIQGQPNPPPQSLPTSAPASPLRLKNGLLYDKYGVHQIIPCCSQNYDVRCRWSSLFTSCHEMKVQKSMASLTVKKN